MNDYKEIEILMARIVEKTGTMCSYRVRGYTPLNGKSRFESWLSDNDEMPDLPNVREHSHISGVRMRFADYLENIIPRNRINETEEDLDEDETLLCVKHNIPRFYGVCRICNPLEEKLK